MRFVHLNGQLVPQEEARISPFDRGFLLGDAVFETLRSYAGRPHALPQHLARLQRSCAVARLPMPGNLAEVVEQVLAANGYGPGGPDASVRITISRGPGGRGASPAGAGPPTVLVAASPIHHQPQVYERGLRLVTAARRRIPGASLEPGMKTTNYLVHVLARIEAEEQGADDALFVDEAGHVVEATQANVFALFGDELATPPLSSGCLPGQVRADLLALAPRLGLRVAERAFTVAELARADEAFLTASLLEVAPVVSVDGQPLGAGAPGPWARRLHEAYRLHATGPG